MSEMLGEEMASYLETIVPFLIQACESGDNAVIKTGGNRTGFEVDSDDSDTDDEGESPKYHLQTQLIDEISQAELTLGHLAHNTGMYFMPYMESSIKLLTSMVSYVDEDVRLNAVESFSLLVGCAHSAYPPDSMWIKVFFFFKLNKL